MKITTYLSLLLLLTSCSNNITLPNNYHIQLLPNNKSLTEITNLKITYIIPQSIASSEGIIGLNFPNSHSGTDTKQEKIIVNFDNKMLKVERRTDNGIAGSGRIYSINITKTNELNNRIITLQPISMSTYQEGAILPFPLPEFDLKSYLTSAVVKYNFELNSEFPAESIRANFDRILGKSNSYYELHLNNGSAFVRIKADPYRSGSKILINSELHNMKHNNGVIDVSKNILELENYIKSIVNS